MKKTIAILIFILSGVFSKAQTFVLSGTVKDVSLKVLELELLYGNDEFDAPSHVIKIASNGRFSQTIPLPYPVFAILKAGSLRQRLLVSPGRDLQLYINKDAQKAFAFSGKAAVENELVCNSVIDTIPFFMKAKWLEDKKQYDETIPYTKVTISGWQDTIMKQVGKELTHNKVVVQNAAIPSTLKRILVSELVYAYQFQLVEFVVNNVRRAKNKNRDSLFTLAIQWQPLPDSLTLESGYFANRIVGCHSFYNIYTISKDKSGGKEAGNARFAAYLQMPYDTIFNLHKIHGGSIENLLYARHHLPSSIQDKIFFNLIQFQIHINTLSSAQFFLQNMKENYPNSNYLARAEADVQTLRKAFETYQENGAINLYDTRGKNKNKLSDLLKPYKGKIVYLDIWGTWCGPCKKEMEYVHELKQRFAGKDVVFVYLDKDEDGREGYWRKYIKDIGLEGQHYRMNDSAINVIWQELQLAGAQSIHSYPSFVIFDRQGKIAHVNAERPSSREKLYEQLDKMLKN